MGLFSRKDWNVLAIIFERADLYQINGQRVKGAAAEKARDGAKRHPRTIFWAVFDQKGAYLEGGPGAGANNVPADAVQRLERELRYNSTIQDVLKTLSIGSEDIVARPMPGAAPSRRPE